MTKDTIVVQISKKHVLKDKAADGDNCSCHIRALRNAAVIGPYRALLIIAKDPNGSKRNRLLLAAATILNTTVLTAK